MNSKHVYISMLKIEIYWQQSKHTMKRWWLTYDAHQLEYYVKIKNMFGIYFFNN